MKYTIRDIASLSGFSIKTVSRVINNEPNIKPSTREKILKVMAETNFKPNLYARNLNNKMTLNILISIRKTQGQNTTKWFDTLMAFIISVANKNRYTILQEVIYDDKDLEYSILETSGGYIDIVVLFYLEENDKRVEIAQKYNIPHIAFEKSDKVAVSVSNNNHKGILDAANFLFHRKLHRICLLLGAGTNVNVVRANAMMEAYQNNGIPLDHLEIVYNMNNLERIKQFVDHKIESQLLPEVFFVSGDEKAVAIYQSIYNHGLSIPGDVSVIGFDNISISQYYYPPLTTVGQNFEQLANELFIAIKRVLNHEENIPSVEVDPHLIVRESVR